MLRIPQLSGWYMPWLITTNRLSSGAFLLTFGKLADMFGRKKLFVAGMAGFTIAMLISGFANNAIYMDVFSGISGLFSAAVVPPAVGTLGVIYEKPSKRKNRAFACFSAGNPLGFVMGTIISGIASDAYNWRASFWAVTVIYAVFTLLTIWTTPNDTGDRTRLTWESFKKFDLLGTFLIVTGIALFSSALTWAYLGTHCFGIETDTSILRLAGDAPDGWRTGYVIALLIIGIVLIACFLYWQAVYTYPLMPLYVWRDRNFSAVSTFPINKPPSRLRLPFIPNSATLCQFTYTISY